MNQVHHQERKCVFNVTTLIRHATSVTYKVESIFEAVYRRCGWVSMSLGGQ